jgi:ectoine hydroxylase-related dioxygenase (phytanoyl-CoA dioxygenase family)
MTRDVFYNKELNDTFLDKGYVVVPFWTANEVAQAQAVFEKYTLASDSNFYLSIWNNDVPSRIAVHERMEPLVARKAHELICDYKFLISCFAVKRNTNASSWSLHQDDSFTDETRFESLSIWVALTDIDETNGAMRVLEGSQRTYVGPRSPTIPKLFSQTDETLLNQMRTVRLKAGEAVIFNHRLLHDSVDNHSQAVRIASVSVMIPQEAPIWFYYNRDGMVDVIKLVDDYYLKFKLGDKPEGVIEQVTPLSDLTATHSTAR